MPQDDNNKQSNKLSHYKQTTTKHRPHLMYILLDISTKNQAPKWLTTIKHRASNGKK
jgi:hypothetical protein